MKWRDANSLDSSDCYRIPKFLCFSLNFFATKWTSLVLNDLKDSVWHVRYCWKRKENFGSYSRLVALVSLEL